MFSEQVIALNGRNVHYYEDGQDHKTTILLLHGGFGDAWLHWNHIMPELRHEGYRTIAPDLPGYGQSDPIASPTPMALVAWVKAFLDELGIADVVVVGNSFGGLTGRLLAANYPQYVPVLVLVNGGVIPAVPTLAQLLAKSPLGGLIFRQIARSTVSRNNLGGLFENQTHLTDEVVSRIQANRNGLARLMRAHSIAPKPEKRTPRVPVLLLWGEEDAITPRIVGEHIQRGIPGSKLELIAATRHLPHIEEPEIFLWQLTAFLKSLSSARAK
ncbi:MAG: hypothetical protein CUN56_06390 [Phototrophicales bacterium]|nr:MAG: hypothetical protein CUN56_06390 [Phototrophicales bacterium]RMG70256.1 MAG: alpha/beta hydrolase [Chloroflexota bacterium]